MRILLDAIEGALQDLPEQALTILIEKKFAAQGVKLSARQRELLTRQIMKGGEDTFRVQTWKWWDRRHVMLEFTPQDVEQIEKQFTEVIENHLPELIRTAIEDMSRALLADLKRKWRAESRLQHRELAGFRKRVCDRWKIPLEGLHMMLTMSRELGDSVNQEIRQSPDASSRRHLIDVLARSHARACQIVEEILCLLEGGFSDGAMARWRTLHEVAVVSSFVAAHGEGLAERYVLHQAVESQRAATTIRSASRASAMNRSPRRKSKPSKKPMTRLSPNSGRISPKVITAGLAATSSRPNPRLRTLRAPRGSTICVRITGWPATTCTPTRRACFSSWNAGGVTSAPRRSQQCRARGPRAGRRAVAGAGFCGAWRAAADAR